MGGAIIIVLFGYIPVMGVYGAGLVVTIISATMADAFMNKKYRYRYFLAIIVLLGVGSLLQTVDWTSQNNYSLVLLHIDTQK
jgi:apolipoprotein N-acyltransferase